jgi:tetratricopeptide (TPR) repeat protein
MWQRRDEHGRGWGRVACAALVALLVAGSGGRAEAQPEDPAARQVERLAAEAASAYKAADYTRAVELLEKAYQLRQVAALLYNLAKAYDKLGEQEKAIELYRRYSDSSDAEPKLRIKAEARVAAYEELHRQRLRDPDPRPRDPDPRPANPPPQVDMRPPPETPEQRTVRLWKARRARDRIIGLTLMGIGVGAALAGIGLSVSAYLIHDSYSTTIGLEDDKRASRDEARTQAIVGDVMYVVAAAGVAVGAYFVWRGFHPEKPPKTRAWLAPMASPTGGGLVLGGSF